VAPKSADRTQKKAKKDNKSAEKSTHFRDSSDFKIQIKNEGLTKINSSSKKSESSRKNLTP